MNPYVFPAVPPGCRGQRGRLGRHEHWQEGQARPPEQLGKRRVSVARPRLLAGGDGHQLLGTRVDGGTN